MKKPKISELNELSICLINPRYDPSFGDYSYSLDLYPGKKRCQMIAGALPTLAGLIDSRHNIKIIDENLTEINFDEMDSYDIVGVTGTIIQKHHMLEILTDLKSRETLVLVGSPLNTCNEFLFEGLCDVSFIGEAENTWPEFVETYALSGTHKGRYEQENRSVMTDIPLPRFDLVDASRYVSVPIQFSRGCPYHCEFCDIPIMFGRRSRVKTPDQFVAEVESVYQQGYRTCFVVDDNFIGKKREAKALLRHIVQWQKLRGYPIVFSTEASVDLADDEELMELMVEAQFTHVFVGIESPSKEALEGSKKFQNLRGDSLLEKVQRIYSHGIIVLGGFIVGFDEDDKSIFEDQFQFITESGIGLASIAILTPIPTTPLYTRLEQEGRLRPKDRVCAFEPKGMSRSELKSGHKELVKRVYAPDHFFDRILSSYAKFPQFRKVRSRVNLGRKTGRFLRIHTFAVYIAFRLLLRILKEGYGKELVPAYWRAWRRNSKLGRGSMPASTFIDLCLKHWHFFKLSEETRITIF